MVKNKLTSYVPLSDFAVIQGRVPEVLFDGFKNEVSYCGSAVEPDLFVDWQVEVVDCYFLAGVRAAVFVFYELLGREDEGPPGRMVFGCFLGLEGAAVSPGQGFFRGRVGLYFLDEVGLAEGLD